MGKIAQVWSPSGREHLCLRHSWNVVSDFWMITHKHAVLWLTNVIRIRPAIGAHVERDKIKVEAFTVSRPPQSTKSTFPSSFLACLWYQVPNRDEKHAGKKPPNRIGASETLADATATARR